MKQTDGLFHQVFNEIAKEYPEIANEHWIVDIGGAKIADTPEVFDVIVMPNLYGDMLSDVAAQITGSVGLAGSSNIGEECAMFEAIHGSAPDIAGKNIANPSGLLQGAVLMLKHLGKGAAAKKIQNAWLKTLEEGIHTPDIYKEDISIKKVGTKEFAEAVIANLGKKPEVLKEANFNENGHLVLPKYVRKPAKNKQLVGVDLFVHWNGLDANQLAEQLTAVSLTTNKLSMITNRGIKVWPQGFKETFCTDHWRCRFMAHDGAEFTKSDIVKMLSNAVDNNIDVIKTENLYEFDGKAAFSLGQGQ
jgi:isocitrate dehydrogenase